MSEEKMESDPWNEPQPVTIDGHTFMMRELTALSLKAHARDFFAIGGRVAGKKEVLDLLRGDAASGKEAAYAEIYAGTMEGYGDEVFAVLSESTDISREAIGKLPVSIFFGLIDAFLDLHGKSLKRFFGVRRRWDEIVAGWKGVPDTELPSSSPASSAGDSATPSAGG
jgi:hypothetical protein